MNCFAPVRSPESKAEAFVKTLKRDYAGISEFADAEQATKQLEQWIENYNEHAPHKGMALAKAVQEASYIWKFPWSRAYPKSRLSEKNERQRKRPQGLVMHF